MQTVLVIPVYNEERHIADLVGKASAYVDKVVVVDDGSTDQTFQKAKSMAGAVVLKHKINLGKGAALKTGCLAAVKLGADIIVMMDGDGQHPPEHIPQMVEKMSANGWQAIFSVRCGGERMPTVRYLGNRVLNIAAKQLFKLNLKDIWCGFRAIKAEILPYIDWRKSDYSGEIQMALKIGRGGFAYGEHSIPTIYNDEFKGVTIINGLKLLAEMIIWRIRL